MNRMALGSLVAVWVGVASCRNPEPPARTPEVPPPSPPASAGASTQQTPPREGTATLAASNTATGAGAQTATPSSDSPMPSASPARLTDDQILYVLHAANLGEMEQARMAEKKAKNARVKRFAGMMLKDHGEADSKGNDVAKKVRASLTPSEPSNRLENDAKHLSAVMSNQNGADFDRSYMNAQVKEHRAVLDMIDRELLPAVTAPEVKELVQTVRAKVEGHLQEAEQILKGLGGG